MSFKIKWTPVKISCSCNGFGDSQNQARWGIAVKHVVEYKGEVSRCYCGNFYVRSVKCILCRSFRKRLIMGYENGAGDGDSAHSENSFQYLQSIIGSSPRHKVKGGPIRIQAQIQVHTVYQIFVDPKNNFTQRTFTVERFGALYVLAPNDETLVLASFGRGDAIDVRPPVRSPQTGRQLPFFGFAAKLEQVF
jgi:hypothetical protein